MQTECLLSSPWEKEMKKLLTMLALGSAVMFLSACNTVEGAGKDVESVGDCADGVKGNC